jgi:hypothetical protein
MQADLQARLLASPGVTAICSRRINWSLKPQGEPMPCIILHLIDGVPDYRVSGDKGLTAARVQVECWALDLKTAKALARAVDAALSGQRFTQGTTRFAGVLIDDEDDDTFVEAPDTFFRTRLDLAVLHAPAL